MLHIVSTPSGRFALKADVFYRKKIKFLSKKILKEAICKGQRDKGQNRAAMELENPEIPDRYANPGDLKVES